MAGYYLMAMEIKPGLPVVNRDVSSSSKSGTPSDGATVRTDSSSVTLTNEAGDLLVAEDKLASHSAVDQVRVSELRQRLEEGAQPRCFIAPQWEARYLSTSFFGHFLLL